MELKEYQDMIEYYEGEIKKFKDKIEHAEELIVSENGLPLGTIIKRPSKNGDILFKISSVWYDDQFKMILYGIKDLDSQLDIDTYSCCEEKDFEIIK